MLARVSAHRHYRYAGSNDARWRRRLVHEFGEGWRRDRGDLGPAASICPHVPARNRYAIAVAWRRNVPLRKRRANDQEYLSPVLPIPLGRIGLTLGIQGIQYQRFAVEDAGIDHPMQQAVGNAPLLMPTMQCDCLVVEPNNPAATLLMIAIEEADNVTDSHLIAT